ncbi:MAG: uracil-DNA glycosylase [Desulfobacterales bacterium]|nr:MAG: uracil-DNA glycosylase [Desulfobacterales bacterium]
MADPKRISCYKCKFFYVTWAPSHPNGCRAMGFKSKQLPSVVVRRTSGQPCQMFQPKVPIKRI